MDKELTLESRLTFGKYQGTKLIAIIMNDPSYVTWLLENTNTQLDNIAFDKYQKIIGDK